MTFRDGINKGEAYFDWNTYTYIDPNAGNTTGLNDGTITSADIMQINHYYPFGLNMEGNWNGAAGNNKYTYNGKEWNDDFGLGWNDYGARWYDPAIARWASKDPLAELRVNVSPYQYVQNNPINAIDPTGMLDESFYGGADGKSVKQKGEEFQEAAMRGDFNNNSDNNNKNKKNDGDSNIKNEDQQQPSLDSKFYVISDNPFSTKINEKIFNEAINDIKAGDSETKNSVSAIISFGTMTAINIDNMSKERIAEKMKYVNGEWEKAKRIIKSAKNPEFEKAFSDIASGGSYIKFSNGTQYLQYPNITEQSIRTAIKTQNRIKNALDRIEGVKINFIQTLNKGIVVIHKIPRA